MLRYWLLSILSVSFLMPLVGQAKESLVELGILAHEAFSKGEYEDAYEFARKVSDLRPDNIRDQMFLGEVSFAAGKMSASVAAYDKVIRLMPSMEPRLWQRGLALYYVDRFHEGVRQFETHQTVNSQDVENAVWHLLCAARVSNVDTARKRLIPISGDRRVPMSQIYEMFAGRVTPEQVIAFVDESVARNQNEGVERSLQLYYAYLYVGLYHEMLDTPDLAMEFIEKAKIVNPLGKTNFMGQVARVHSELRLLQSAKF